MAKRVTTIPATINIVTAQPIGKAEKRRVAGYARVSTDLEEQQSSYQAQMDYYSNYIQSRDDWEFVGMYSDEGISATNTKRREGFKQIVEDALEGKIDLIITKSVSRFARNTVDSLTTVRKLKEQGIEIYFEKENIWTLDAKGELLITIMSSLAQEESRSISENTTWGQRKRFADGKASVAYKRFLGYDRGPNGGFVINEEQAKTVRYIYKCFLEGMSYYTISLKLMEIGAGTPGGQKKWHAKTIESILTNEKYKGDALLQKYYTVDFLSKKMKKNEGQVPQYYVENNHTAIIDPATFDLVQAEIMKRTNGKNRYSGVGLFASKIKCGQCGSWYGAKVWHSNSKYRREIYRCNHKFKNDKKCETPHLTEEEVKQAFISAVNQLILEKEEVITNVELVCQTICNTESLEQHISTLEQELRVLVEMVQNCINENAHTAQDQERYQKRYNELATRYDVQKGEYDKISDMIVKKKAKTEILKGFIKRLQKQERLIDEFDKGLWSSLVEFITVNNKEDIRITFKDGMEINSKVGR
ncbi:MAG: site-specific recombinase [Paenibacillus sp.]|jgi:DNA invertase Pin-like site-specific DNA recombinase|nr:site-specific recombinase [Paenibacillus sp.]